MSQFRSSLPLTLLLFAGCTGGVIGSTEDESHSPEVTVTGDALRTKFERADSWYISPPLELGEKATRVAAMWTALSVERPLAIQARGVDASGLAGKWHALELAFSEEELGVARIDLEAEYPRVQIRVPEADAKMIALLTFTGSRPDILLDDSLDIGQSTLGLAADLSAAGILPRSAWGARAARCGNNDRAKERMAIHHTASARTAGGSYEGLLRQTQSYHMDGRGYCDVGYHFFVTADGRVWEARNVDHVGGHSGNYNGGNIGIVLVGCFDSSGACNNLGGRDVPEAMMAGTARAVAALASRYSIPINSDRIKGHGQQPYQQTACPGDAMRNRLEELRDRARGSNPPQQPPQQPSTPPAGPSRSCGGLNNNEALVRGSEMRSCNGLYLFAHQSDGNIVLYNTYSGTAVWSTGTNGRSTDTLVMQGDGNFVLYAPGGRAIWSSGTNGASGATLGVQDDGNVVIYVGARAVWSTNTVGAGGTPPQQPPQQPPQEPPPQQPSTPCGILGSGAALGEDQGTAACGGRYSFVHQSDGNIVLYNNSRGRAIWSTGTHGRNTSSLVMQADGNLVLYSPSGSAVWSTGTHGHAGAFLGVQDDGNVVVYTSNGWPLWATDTVGR
jgi:hypothetical protein